MTRFLLSSRGTIIVEPKYIDIDRYRQIYLYIIYIIQADAYRQLPTKCVLYVGRL